LAFFWDLLGFSKYLISLGYSQAPGIIHLFGFLQGRARFFRWFKPRAVLGKPCRYSHIRKFAHLCIRTTAHSRIRAFAHSRIRTTALPRYRAFALPRYRATALLSLKRQWGSTCTVLPHCAYERLLGVQVYGSGVAGKPIFPSHNFITLCFLLESEQIHGSRRICKARVRFIARYRWPVFAADRETRG
jgi:hypothetical protein